MSPPKGKINSEKMSYCKNCGNKESGNYCSHCGAPIKLERIDSHYISHEIQNLLNFERGFFFTAKSLLLKPGKSIRQYVNENRSKYMKPLTFLIFTSLVFTVIAYSSNIEYSFFNINKIKPLQGLIKKNVISSWLQGYIGYTNLIIGVFVAIWTRLFFKKKGYNFFEIIILFCFALGESLLLLSLALIIALTISPLIGGLISLFSMGYTFWAVGQFFGGRKLINYVKAFIAYILGVLSYIAVIIGIGFLLDFLA